MLQINVATMAALGTLLLGMWQRNPALPMWMPLWMLIAAIASVWLTDMTGWFRLNRTVTNLLSVVVFFIFVWQLSELRGLVRILAIGNLLAYLQIILLFQQKDPRTYGQLALLSLLQVVVAAVFRQKALFGLLLVVYLFVGLSALVLLFLHRERLRHRPAAGRLPPRTGGGRRWPLAGQEPSFTDSTSGFAGQAGIGRELRRRVIGMGFGTLVLTSVIFFSLPRWGLDPWRGAMGQRIPTVGFSDEVTLGELGSILENPEEVLRIRFSEYFTGAPYHLRAEEDRAENLYLRGTVLTHYEDGKWDAGPVDPDLIVPLGATPLRTNNALVRQKIVIEPMDHEALFCVWPFATTGEDQRLYINPARQLLLRSHDQMTRRFAYELATNGFHDGRQTSLIPASRRDQTRATEPLRLPPRGGKRALPNLRALADRWVQQSGLESGSHFTRARLLERQLRDSGRFQYSLEGQRRDPSLDPIEDFVARNPQGHCEYFATALVLMLRSQGIPARMVVGYKTDEWNDVGHFFQVRQLHAHTWVEAYLAPAQLEGRPGRADVALETPCGAWLRLDPTPAGSVTRVSRLVDWFGKSFDWLDFLWTNYVMEMDRPRQHEVVYDPVADAISQAARRLLDPGWWRATLDGMARALGTGLRNLILVLAAVVLAVALFVAVQVLRVMLGRWRRRVGGQAAGGTGSVGAGVEFYRRLEAILVRFALVRPASQTQREFAREAGRKIAASTGHDHLAHLPGQVVEAFYRVRFGNVPLDNLQADAVEQALRQLKQSTGSRQ
jgi:hypothetical protein